MGKYICFNNREGEITMFIKEKHIELSDGETYIVSNKNCPLTEEEASTLGIIVSVDDEKEIPCCACTAYLAITDEGLDFQCPNYFGYINSEEKGEFFDCRNILNLKKDLDLNSEN